MTDPDIRTSVESLGATVDRLRDAVGYAGDQQATLAEQVIQSNVSAARDRKMLRILTGLVIFKLITLLVLVFVIFSLNDANHAIRDCTTPQGQCAKRGAASTAVFLSGTAWRGERERLLTELPIAEAKGDTVRVDLGRKRLAELNAEIANADKQLADIRNGTTKP